MAEGGAARALRSVLPRDAASAKKYRLNEDDDGYEEFWDKAAEFIRHTPGALWAAGNVRAHIYKAMRALWPQAELAYWERSVVDLALLAPHTFAFSAVLLRDIDPMIIDSPVLLVRYAERGRLNGLCWADGEKAELLTMLSKRFGVPVQRILLDSILTEDDFERLEKEQDPKSKEPHTRAGKLNELFGQGKPEGKKVSGTRLVWASRPVSEARGSKWWKRIPQEEEEKGVGVEEVEEEEEGVEEVEEEPRADQEVEQAAWVKRRRLWQP
jgi:hypothetical protein